MTTKELYPPRDGRADIVWKLVRLLEEEKSIRVVILSLCPQPVEVTARFETVTVPWSLSMGGFIRALFRGLPLQVALYENTRLANRLVEAARRYDLDVVVADMARTGLLALKVPAGRKILDMDDRLSRRYRRQAIHGHSGAGFGQLPQWLSAPVKRLSGPLEGPILRFEAGRLERFEIAMARTFDATVMVSEVEARDLAADSGCIIHTVPNYVELSSLPPPGTRDHATLLFFGNMSTAHNVDTAVHLADEIFPLIKRMVPEAKLLIVGRNMSRKVMNLGEIGGVVVHPNAPEIEPFLASAAVCVCPMRFGSGIKTKILEAIHAGLPVVTTPVGAEGIPDAPSCMIVETEPKKIAEAAVSILLRTRNIGEMAESGRRMLDANYSRESVRGKWLSVIFGVNSPTSDRRQSRA